jgi:predicted porin
MRDRTILLFVFIFPFVAVGQIKSSQENWIEDALELLLENQNESSDRSDLELSLKEWIKNPIQLNKASKQDLEGIFFLNQTQIQAIIDHRNTFGDFLSKYELQAVTGLDANCIHLLNQICQFEEQQSVLNKTIFDKYKNGNHELIFQHKRDFQTPSNSPTHFAGSPDYFSIRYRFQYKTNWYMGFAAEKDPGEKWGIMGDFQTFHLFIKGQKRIKTLAIGDFHLNLGTGLCMGSSHFSGKSSLVFQTQILQNGFRPSRSLSEMGFLRGIGISLGGKNKQIDIWLSGSPISATVLTDSLMKIDYLAGILLSGLHRTPQELAKKNAAIQQNYGFHLSLIKPSWQLGFILQKKEASIQSQIGTYKNVQNLLNLGSNTHSSCYGSKQVKNIFLQYEFALQNWSEKAFIIKSIIPMHSKLDGLVLYRNYDAKYTNSAANGWSAQSNLGNETGFYWAFIFKPKKGHTISLFADAFKTKSAAFQKFKPAMGSDFFITYQLTMSKVFQLEARYRKLNVEKNSSKQLAEPIIQMANNEKHQIRLQLNYQLHESWKYQCKIEWTSAQNNSGTWVAGSLIYSDIHFQPKNNKLRLRIRYCLYQVADYAARLYMPENDLPLNYSNKMLSDRGYYCYFLGSYALNKHVDVYFKYAYNFIPENDVIQNKRLEFSASSESTVKCQIRIKF